MSGETGGRRAEVLDAAIRVVGASGIDGLTHRSVDVAAGVPSGTTSNHFRTRDALLLGVITEIEKLRRAVWRGLQVHANPSTQAELVDFVCAYVDGAVTFLSARVRAYMVLLMEGWSRPELREPLQRGRDAQVERTLQLLRSVNPATSELHAGILQDYLTGIIYQQLANPEPNFDARPAVDTLIALLIAVPTSGNVV